MENKELEKKQLEEAAELLKNINLTDSNSNQLQELIKQIQLLSNQKEEIEREEFYPQDEKPLSYEERLKQINNMTGIDGDRREFLIKKLNIEFGIPLDGAYHLDGKDVEESFSKFNEKLKEERKNKTDLSPIVVGQTVLPAFLVVTNKGLTYCDNFKLVERNPETNEYLLDNGKEKLVLSAKTFESIINPQSVYPNPKKEETILYAENNPSIVKNQTLIPEFALITQNGLETFQNMKLTKYNEQEKSYKLSNGEKELIITEETFKEISSPERFEKQFSTTTPAYEKMIQTQYNDYFKQRDNTAYNFRHNLSVYCRKEANSPLDAIKLAKEIVDRMSKEEQQKTRLLLNNIKREDETINQFLVRAYFDAIKEVPLNEDIVKQKYSEAKIAKPFYDTLSTVGEKIDKDSNLKIGDTIENIAFNMDKVFGPGKEKIYETLTVISSSKEGNSIILMDKDKSFYEIPRDELLISYNKQQEKIHKAEVQQQRRNSVEIER